MKIYPKCEHIQFPMMVSSVLGFFPSEFLFKSNLKFQKYYKFYGNVMAIYLTINIITQYMQLYVIVKRDGLKMDAISANLTVTLLYTIGNFRQFIIKFNPKFKNIIRSMLEQENLILAGRDPDIIRIYNDCCKNTLKKTITYLSLICLISSQYYIRPLVSQPLEYQVGGNETVTYRILPISMWFPFDQQTHYLAAFLWQIPAGLTGVSFFLYTDVFMLNLISYPSGQLKILLHLLRNFETYKQKCKQFNNVANDEMAGCMTFSVFITEHKKIIQFINDFNDCLSLTMVFDFLQSSLQIASVMTQVLGSTLTYDLMFFIVTSVLGMLVRLILYYYYANEVIILSDDLSTAVWESNWYEQSPKVKFMMLIFIMKVAKPLQFLIGPFSVMSLNSFIIVLKATYSYLTLMYDTGTTTDIA